MLPVEYPYGGPLGSEGWGPNSPSGAYYSTTRWHERYQRRNLSDHAKSVSFSFVSGEHDRQCVRRHRCPLFVRIGSLLRERMQTLSLVLD